MQMIVDAALITKKAPALDYNTDSVNAAGKIWPREIVHSENGIKAAGKSQGKPYYVLASSNAKGTAESAADLFKNCVASFLPDGSNYSEAIAEFFRAFSSVLDKSGYDSSSCNLAVFAGYGDRVFLAKSGSAKLFRCSEEEFFEAKPQLFPHEDGAANYGVSVYSEVKPGDIFVLLSGNVGACVSESLVKAIIRNANGDIKRTVALIASNAVKNGCDDAVSAVVLKIIEADAEAAPAHAAALPVYETADAADLAADDDAQGSSSEEKSSYAAGSRYYVPTEEDLDAEAESTEKLNRYKSRNKVSRIAIIDVCIVLAVIIILLVVLAVKGVFRPSGGQSTKEGVNMSDLFTELETTTKKTKEDEKESTTAEATTARATTTEAGTSATQRQTTPATTRQTPVVTMPATQRQPVTQRPVTETPRTEPPVTEPPVTEPPVTEPPVTQPPVTEPPVTQPPVTESPTKDPNIADDD